MDSQERGLVRGRKCPDCRTLKSFEVIYRIVDPTLHSLCIEISRHSSPHLVRWPLVGEQGHGRSGHSEKSGASILCRPFTSPAICSISLSRRCRCSCMSKALLRDRQRTCSRKGSEASAFSRLTPPPFAWWEVHLPTFSRCWLY
jgi:hypothetical protein